MAAVSLKKKTRPNTTLCTTNGSAQLTTSPPANNGPYYGWPYFGGFGFGLGGIGIGW